MQYCLRKIIQRQLGCSEFYNNFKNNISIFYFFTKNYPQIRSNKYYYKNHKINELTSILCRCLKIKIKKNVKCAFYTLFFFI